MLVIKLNELSGLLSLELGDDIFINCSWVVTQWQYTFIHKQYVEQHK